MGPVAFYPLPVAAVSRLTDDATAVRFAVPGRLRETFAFSPGQWLTVRRGGERRSYSICAPADTAPRIGVREIPGGAVSGWLVREVRPGDVIDVAPPAGTFTPDLSVPEHHVLIGAGSGITPLLSIAASVLAAQPRSRVTLVYGNRRASSVMFADEVADLKDAYPARVQVVHVLSREARQASLLSGRLDAGKLRTLVPACADVAGVGQWWLCGPREMTEGARAVLTELGVGASRIHRELFYAGTEPPPPVARADAAGGAGAAVTVILGGRASTVTVPWDVPVLDGAQRARADLPFACKGGVCGTCRALVTSGRVTMRRNYALEDSEVAAGYVLTCQSLPATESVTADYDS